MGRVRQFLVSSLLFVLSAVPCLTGNDGITLTVSRGATPGDVVLEWQGGASPYGVYRSENPADITSPDNSLGTTSSTTWFDTPPVGDLFFYRVSVFTADDCTSPYPMSTGVNTIHWSGTTLDYLTDPSCTVAAVTGPDVVAEYTSGVNGSVDIIMDKPAGARYAMVISDSECGILTPELACYSDLSNTVIRGTLEVTFGTTYWFYVVDTISGDDLLPNPIVITLTEIDCATFSATAFNESPPHGSTASTLRPTFSVDFDGAIDTTTGLITIIGDLGTTLAYDLSSGPPEVSFSNFDTTMIIDPGVLFPPGESITVSLTALQDALCGNAISPPPLWIVQIPVPPCTPGSGGMVGSTLTRLAAPGTITEYYVAPDEDPLGWVYYGGTTSLLRIPKAGGPVEDVETAAGLTTSQLGYAMLINGTDIFTLDNVVAATGVLWRISTDGGATWNVEDFATFPMTPGDDLRGVTAYDGRIYMIAHESTAVGTEIWSVDANATVLPDTAVLEGSFLGQGACSGLAMDDLFYYTACETSTTEQNIVRIDRTTFAVDVLSNAFDTTPTKNTLHARDADDDGTTDFLYVKTWFEEGYYVCDPGGVPFADLHFLYGSTSASYGMGYDPVGNTLWTYDDDTRELVRVD